MSRYILIRRLFFPSFLLLVGALALLNQTDILSWGKSWPFFLILLGVLKLAERAALASEGTYPPAPYPGAPYAGASSPAGQAPETKAIVPANRQEYEQEPDRDPDGGQQ